MEITAEHIDKKRRVGKLGHNPVFAISTTGGLHLVVVARGGQAEVLGTGSHAAIARHIAKKREEKIEWSDLNKSDHVPYACFEDILPRYEALTEQFRNRQGL